MKKIFIIMMVTAIMLVCAGCGMNKTPESKLIGTWIGEGTSEELVFYKDGSYKSQMGAFQVSGDYKLVSDEEIELTSNAQGLGADMEHVAGIHGFSLEGDTLIIKGGGAAGTYHKSK